jgi:hypothetical protein
VALLHPALPLLQHISRLWGEGASEINFVTSSYSKQSM